MKILCCIESFLPGLAGGGPVRALDNMLQHLSATHCFHVLTRNHDYLQTQIYPDIISNEWFERDGYHICYAEDTDCADKFFAICAEWNPDYIYLNGALAPLTRAILCMRRKSTELLAVPVIIAPHGNFGSATLRHHHSRKFAWLTYAKFRSLYRDVIWHAASEREAEQIRKIFGVEVAIRIVPMAPALGADNHTPSSASPVEHQPPALRLVYFGRLSPEKNLPFAFDLLNAFAVRHPQQAVVYDLIGSGNADYIEELQSLSSQLPDTIQVNFIGQLSPEALQARLNQACNQPSEFSGPYRAMLMPSQTENFSYTVLESFQAGIPVIISDQTPWRDLQAQGVGWDLPLAQRELWLEALNSLLNAVHEERLEMQSKARAIAVDFAATYLKKVKSLFPKSKPVHLLIDATSLSQRLKGVGRYTFEVCKRLKAALPEGWRVSMLVYDVDLPKEIDAFGFEIHHLTRGREATFGLITLPYMIRRLKPDLLWRPADSIGHDYAVPTLTTCHDIDALIHQVSDPLPLIRRCTNTLRFFAKKRGIRASREILCVSNYIRERIPGIFGIPAERCRTNYLGLDLDRTPSAQDTQVSALRGAYGDDGYVFAIATGDSRENSDMLVGIYAAARQAGFKGSLVVAGLDLHSTYAHQLKRAMQFAGFVADKDFYFLPFFPSDRYYELLCHFAAAKYYLETSLHEAFPTQVMEAMATGTVCLTTGRGGLGEIGADYSLLISADSMQQAGEVLAQADKAGRHLSDSEAQIAYCRQFTWESCTATVAQRLQMLTNQSD